MDEKVTSWINTILGTAVNGFNKGLEFFGIYTSKYSKGILILIGLFLATKMLNIKLNLGGGGKR